MRTESLGRILELPVLLVSDTGRSILVQFDCLDYEVVTADGAKC